MARIMVEAWRCELCGHVWLLVGGVAPDKCSKCRKRGWNLQAAENLAIGSRCRPELEAVRPAAPAESTAAVAQVADRRRAKKAARHRELKTDAAAAVVAGGVPAAFLEKIQTPATDHHPCCRCFRCKPPAKEPEPDRLPTASEFQRQRRAGNTFRT